MNTSTLTRTPSSAWPLGYRWFGLPLMARMALRDLRRHPVGTAVGAITGLVAGLALVVSGRSIGPVSIQTIMVLLLVAVPAALAGGTHPEQRHEAEILVRQGCRRTAVRLACWAGSVAAVAIPAWIGAALGSVAIDTTASLSFIEAAWWGLTLPALGAALTAGARLPERTDRSPTKVTRGKFWRWGIGLALLVPGAYIPTTARGGFDLDLLLPLGFFLTFAGLAVLSPLAVGAAARIAGRVPSTVVRVAGGVLDRNRRALSLPFALIAGATCLLVVQSVVGVGLGRREQSREAAISALGPATAGTSANQLVVTTSVFEKPNGTSGDDLTALLDATREAAPGASVASVEGLAFDALSGRAVYGEVAYGLVDGLGLGSQVAVATPELLTVLGLDPALAEGDRAVVLDPRVVRTDGRVGLVRRTDDDDNAPSTEVLIPARLSRASGLAARVPAVLLPPDIVPSAGSTSLASDRLGLRAGQVVLRFGARPTEQTVEALRAVTGGTVVRGDQPVDVTAHNRTDNMGSVSIRTEADAQRLLTTVGVLCLAVVFVAQLALALAHRREDEVLDLLGTRRRTRVTVAAVRGLILGLVATGSGAVIALSATAWGLRSYNDHNRFDGPTHLEQIPFVLTPPVAIAMAALPLAAGLAGGLVALVRRRSDHVTRTERLAW